VVEGAIVLARQETARGEIALRRREGADGQPIYEIISNGVFLMASTNGPSARQLAHLGLEPLQGRGGLRLLIGGLGMGYTLQAALEHSAVTRVEVVEVEPLIVEWAQAYFGPLNGDALADRRVQVVVDDLARYLETASGPYDAILLDVDNGPTWLVVEENAEVYGRPALELMRALLAPGGVLAVWAAEPAPDFLAELESVFGWADEEVVEEEGRTTAYFIYRAQNGRRAVGYQIREPHSPGREQPPPWIVMVRV
jgi:spermidine synthase